MEVVTPGRDYLLETACTGRGNGGKGCGAVLRVSRDDLRWFAEQEFPWRIQPAAVVFRCPCCTVMTDLEEKDWPYRYQTLKAWSGAWRDGVESAEIDSAR